MIKIAVCDDNPYELEEVAEKIMWRISYNGN